MALFVCVFMYKINNTFVQCTSQDLRFCVRHYCECEHVRRSVLMYTVQLCDLTRSDYSSSISILDCACTSCPCVTRTCKSYTTVVRANQNCSQNYTILTCDQNRMFKVGEIVEIQYVFSNSA